MTILALILVAIVAALHFGFLILEMLLWNTPAESAVVAANQGLYNGFLSAGLVWSLMAADPVGFQTKVLFLLCAILAGLYGATTVNKRILFIQAVPAALASLRCCRPLSEGTQPG